MRKKFIWFVLGAVALLLCTKLKSQNFVNEEMGVSIQFDGKPTQDASSIGKHCSSFYANSSYVKEFVEVCNYADTGDLSDDQVQQRFIDAVEKKYTIAIGSGSVAGYPGKTFTGNWTVDEGTGGYIWGEVTNLRHGTETRMYTATVIQMKPVRGASKIPKLDRIANRFLDSLKILDQPHVDANQPAPVVTSTTAAPAAQAATPPAASASETLADLSPPATQQETDYYNKLLTTSPDQVNAFIETRKWFRKAYALYPNFKYTDVDVNKLPPPPKDYSNDFTFTQDESMLGIVALAVSNM